MKYECFVLAMLYILHQRLAQPILVSLCTNTNTFIRASHSLFIKFVFMFFLSHVVAVVVSFIFGHLK